MCSTQQKAICILSAESKPLKAVCNGADSSLEYLAFAKPTL
ncbi:hypothetical protein [Helicobacter typhlonius]